MLGISGNTDSSRPVSGKVDKGAMALHQHDAGASLDDPTLGSQATIEQQYLPAAFKHWDLKVLIQEIRDHPVIRPRSDGRRTLHRFHKFMELPPELRE